MQYKYITKKGTTHENIRMIELPDDAEGVAFMVNDSSYSSKYNELSRMIWNVDSRSSDQLTNDIQVSEDGKELKEPLKIGVAKAGED
ncbi:hypothetical protein JTB14_027724 [Gonioctena quinquepunctata]|nr:hypothetical protein JTB14_027724 [Gonioctena quinquepunctata]